MTEEEKKYKEVISALKSLPKVKSKSDFEQKLYRRLRNVESEKLTSPAFEKLTRPKERNWIFNIFRPSFAPAIALTIVLVVVIVVYINFIPKNDEITQTEQSQQKTEEMIIKDPGSIERSTSTSEQENGNLITQDITGGMVPDEYSPMPVGPTTDVDEVSAPTLSQPEKLDEVPVMEQQKMERKEAEEKIFDKEGKIEKKSDDMKKVEKKESRKTEKSDEELNLKKNVGEEFFQRGMKPSMGVEKGKSKDSLKTDSIKSKNGKDEGLDTEIEQKNETEKPAEQIQQEPTTKEK